MHANLARRYRQTHDILHIRALQMVLCLDVQHPILLSHDLSKALSEVHCLDELEANSYMTRKILI